MIVNIITIIITNLATVTVLHISSQQELKL